MPYLYNIASTFIVQVKCMPVIYCFCPDIQVTVYGVRNMYLMRPKTYTLLNLNMSDALNGRRMLIEEAVFGRAAGIITFKLRIMQAPAGYKHY